MTTALDPNKTALLLLDLQAGLLARFPKAEPLLDTAASAIATARKHGVTVSYIRVALTEDEANAVPETNLAFASFKKSPDYLKAMHPDAPPSQIHEKVKPEEGDLVYRKIRYGPFMAHESKGLLDAYQTKGITTVILGGIATSGAVLSSVRQLADLDYGLVVLEDLCGDQDDEVHKVLVEKVFPKQAKVIKSTELDSLF